MARVPRKLRSSPETQIGRTDAVCDAPGVRRLQHKGSRSLAAWLYRLERAGDPRAGGHPPKIWEILTSRSF
jgi:hypothetical protein